MIEAISYRLVPHSSDDDDRTYRKKEEVEEARKKDPLVQFNQYLQDSGLLDEEKENALNREIAHLVDEATEYAEAAPYPEAEETYTHVYAE